MMQKKIIVHVGQPKCGSKSLQHLFFFKHPDIALFNRYNGSKDNVSITLNVEEELFRPKRPNLSIAREGFDSMRRISDSDIGVFSAEGITSGKNVHYTEKAKRLRTALQENAKIIIVFREPIPLLKSIFWQMIIYYRKENQKEFDINLWVKILFNRLNENSCTSLSQLKWIRSLFRPINTHFSTPLTQLNPGRMLQTYQELFEEKNVFPMLVEEMSYHPDNLFKRLCEFMEINLFTPTKDNILNSTDAKKKIAGISVNDEISESTSQMIHNFTYADTDILHRAGLPVQKLWTACPAQGAISC